MSKVNIEFKLLHELAQAPKYAHDGDAGADLVCIEDVTLEPGERLLVSTGVAIALPSGPPRAVKRAKSRCSPVSANRPLVDANGSDHRCP